MEKEENVVPGIGRTRLGAALSAHAPGRQSEVSRRMKARSDPCIANARDRRTDQDTHDDDVPALWRRVSLDDALTVQLRSARVRSPRAAGEREKCTRGVE